MFKRAIEGHLLQVGAGYMTNPDFVAAYDENKLKYLKSLKFWNKYRISPAQALYDKEYLYGILVTATMKLQHKTIFKHEHSLDGIMAWQELKSDYEYDGSRELKLEQLEALIQVPYSNSDAGGIATYIDKFQATFAELAAIDPEDYTDNKMKRQLLMNVRTASGISHLITKCQDSWNWGFDQCASYLRKNAMMIDYANTVKTPARLMLVEDTPTRKIAPVSSNPTPDKTLEQVSRMFYTMAEEHGLENTFRMYQTQQFRESLNIPSEIWVELEPAIKEKINELRTQIKARRAAQGPNRNQRNYTQGANNSKNVAQGSNNSYKSKTPTKDEKIPNQYPTMKNQQTIANLVNSIATLDVSDGEDTDDDMADTTVYMVRSRIAIDHHLMPPVTLLS